MHDPSFSFGFWLWLMLSIKKLWVGFILLAAIPRLYFFLWEFFVGSLPNVASFFLRCAMHYVSGHILVEQR